MSSDATRASWARRAYWALDNSIRTDVWIVQGRERVSGERLCFCYAGSKPNITYLIDLAFSGEREEQYLGRKWVWDIARLAREAVSRVDAVVMEIKKKPFGKTFLPGNSLFIPCWVSGEVSIPIEFLRHSTKDDRRLVRKNKYKFIITKDLSKVLRFYETMYLPLVKGRHGNKAFFADLKEIQRKVSQGGCELLMINDQDHTIGGQLILFEAPSPRLWSFGVLNGDPLHLRNGAFAAAIIFSSDYLSKQGHVRMNLGESRAFLSDGVLQYKTKWGWNIRKSSQRGYMLSLLESSAGLQSFLCTNPFLCIEDGALSIVAFAGDEGEDGHAQVAKALERANSLGVSNSQVYSFLPQPADVVVEGQAIKVRSVTDLFHHRRMGRDGFN
jgi:hypothetical protein